LNQGLKPDPTDIDGGNSTLKSKSLGFPANSPTVELLTELDGINKYMQGVKMPTAISGNLSYTLKDLKKTE